MTACRNIEEMMSAYLDGEVSPDEERLVREHLASCPGCRATLEDLRRTATLVKGLEEVEPPPWLAQKIMAHVKDEAEKEEGVGIFRRIFYPFRLKIPIQAFATLLIVGVVFYVYKSNEPRFEAARVPVKTEEATPRKAPAAPPTAGVPAPTKRPVPEAPRDGGTAGPAASPLAPPSRGEDAVGAAAPAPGSDSSGVSRDEAGGALLLRSAERAEADREAAKEKGLQKAEVPAPAQGSRAPMALQAPKRAAVKRPEPIDIMLRVVDVKAAADEVEAVLRQTGARNVTRESREGSESLTAEVEREKTGVLAEKLDDIGDAEPLLPRSPAGSIAITIKVVPGG